MGFGRGGWEILLICDSSRFAQTILSFLHSLNTDSVKFWANHLSSLCFTSLFTKCRLSFPIPEIFCKHWDYTMIYTTCKCLGQMAREACRDPLDYFLEYLKISYSACHKSRLWLFPPALSLIALPAFKTSLSAVCMSLCSSKPEDKKGQVALRWYRWATGSINLSSLLSFAAAIFQKNIQSIQNLPRLNTFWAPCYKGPNVNLVEEKLRRLLTFKKTKPS